MGGVAWPDFLNFVQYFGIGERFVVGRVVGAVCGFFGDGTMGYLGMRARGLAGLVLAVVFVCGGGMAICDGVGGYLAANGGFEALRGVQAEGWGALWTRDAGAGELAFDEAVRHGGRYSARVEHRGERDWSINAARRVAVRSGDILELSCWVRVRGSGDVMPCVTAYGADGTVRDWSLGGRGARETAEWVEVRSRFVVGEGIAEVLPRVIGTGAATVWVDDYSLVAAGNVEAMRGAGLPGELVAGNSLLELRVDTRDGRMAVKDRRTGRVWGQRPFDGGMVVLEAREQGGAVRMRLLEAATGMELRVACRVAADAAEVEVAVEGEGAVSRVVQYPYPFAGEAGDWVIVPMNEGIGFPVDDDSIGGMHLVGYGGHGICMSFWGMTDGEAGQMAIIETPDDMRIRMDRVGGRLAIGAEWEGQKGRFGYARRLRYVFFEDGGHVAMCKRYRGHAEAAGLVKTLREKREANAHVDLLVGAVNVWCWERDAVGIVKEMQAAGIERILWSNRGTPESIAAMNAMEGVLTSRYDIFQDLMDPEVVRTKLRGTHADWTQDGWPRDLMRDERGDWRKGWQVRGKDGVMYPCGVLCDRQAVEYAKKRVPEDLKTHGYRSRFIDTTTASPWRECYDAAHPMTRTESREWKMRLLAYMSKDAGLVTGSETGHDAAVPWVHYFEGMLSLGPYRVPDAGRDMVRVWDEVPERVAKFQVGEKYRLPLWELVYHDCVVAQWYWGDYNNKLPAIWGKRDLFNVLYGTPPMFMFTRAGWNADRERFVESYRRVCPVVRAVGYEEMVDHRVLTADRSVQQTEFGNGVRVTVNFGERAHRLADGREVEGMGFVVDGCD